MAPIELVDTVGRNVGVVLKSKYCDQGALFSSIILFLHVKSRGSNALFQSVMVTYALKILNHRPDKKTTKIIYREY